MLINDVNFKIFFKPQDYEVIASLMEEVATDISLKKQKESVFLLEHSHVYTLGSSALENDLINKNTTVPIIKSNRGGKITYHGKGQQIIYIMLDLKRFNLDIKKYILALETFVINILKDFGVKAFLKEGLIGVFVKDKKGSDKKIAAIGVKVKKQISYHGISININPNLSYFNDIVPCGIKEFGVTSLEELGVFPNKLDLYKSIKTNFNTYLLQKN